MKKTHFLCKTVTPVFSGGADKDKPELRPPTIKGSMRFWWRAIKGLSLETLKKGSKSQKCEGAIFGASNEKLGKSKFNIKTYANLKTEQFQTRPYRDSKKDSEGIVPNLELSIHLSTYNHNINFYSQILKGALILGGIGKRSRRGYGKVKILSVNNQPFNFDYNLESILKIVNSISDDYEIDSNRIILKSSQTSNNPRYLKEVYPYLKEIQISQVPLDSWKEAVKKIRKATHNYAKHDSIGFAKGRERLASPIYVSIIEKSANKFLPIISTLETVFKTRGNTPDYRIQEKFKEEILY